MTSRCFSSAIFVCALAAIAVAAAGPTGAWSRDDRRAFQEGKWARVREAIAHDQTHKYGVDQSGFDVLHYDLDLSVDPAAATIAGTVSADVKALASLAVLVLDLSDSLTVSEVRVEGSPAGFQHQNDLLTISLVPGRQPGQEFTLEVDYSGNPDAPNTVVNRAAFAFDTHGSGELVVFSFSAPTFARAWWPCKDVLDDKATVRTAVTVPDTLVVASNGILEEETDLADGTRRFTWYESYPIATYLVSLAASNYSVYRDYYRYAADDSMEVVYFVYPEHLAEARVDFAPTVSMVEYYAETFGEYPFLAEKYGMAEVETGFSAMEHQTCTSYSSYLIRGDNRYDWVVAHELSHMWWGDMITAGDWRDIWLNEGFATYCEALWIEHTEGRQAYFDYMDGMRWPFGPFPGTVYDPDLLYNSTVYDKGAWVLHMLRWVMGDQAFLNAMRAYGNDVRYVYGNAVTDDFRAACEAEYGGGLGWFFDQWVYSEGEPAYDYYTVKTDAGSGQRVDLSIVQVQQGVIYEMPLEVRFTMASGDSSVTVWNNRRAQSFSFTMPAPVSTVALDPDGWVLGDKTEKTLASQPYVEVQPNPFNRGTAIVFETTVAGPVSVLIYDVSGAPVRTLHEGPLPPAFHRLEWDGRNGNGDPAASGVYFVDVHTPNGRATQRAVIAR